MRVSKNVILSRRLRRAYAHLTNRLKHQAFKILLKNSEKNLYLSEATSDITMKIEVSPQHRSPVTVLPTFESYEETYTQENYTQETYTQETYIHEIYSQEAYIEETYIKDTHKQNEQAFQNPLIHF